MGQTPGMNCARLVARRLHAVVGRRLSHHPKRHSPHCRPLFHGTMRSRPSISVVLLEPHRITTADRTSLKHRSVHPPVDLVVLSRGTQDARIPGEVPPGEGRHHASRAGASPRAADRGVLDSVSVLHTQPRVNRKARDDARDRNGGARWPHGWRWDRHGGDGRLPSSAEIAHGHQPSS
jgi:hypothetical protein